MRTRPDRRHCARPRPPLIPRARMIMRPRFPRSSSGDQALFTGRPATKRVTARSAISAIAKRCPMPRTGRDARSLRSRVAGLFQFRRPGADSAPGRIEQGPRGKPSAARRATSRTTGNPTLETLTRIMRPPGLRISVGCRRPDRARTEGGAISRDALSAGASGHGCGGNGSAGRARRSRS